MAAPDQFDLEQGLMDCWHTANDLKLVAENVLSGDSPTPDSVANALLGLAELHELRMRKTWEVFETLLAQRDLG